MDSVRAFLFDMDGTLVDSDAAVERAWTRWAAEYAVDPEVVLAVAHGVPSDATVARVRPDLSAADARVASLRQLELQYDDLVDVVACPGAHELLAAVEAAGIPWAVVTSADDRLAANRLGAAGIVAPLLVTVDDVTVDGVVHGKPDPEGYLLAARELGVDPRECLVVEDSPGGVRAGRAAGATVAGLKGVEADLALTSLLDLLPHVTR
ncbi:HAD-IA family hydrolase [Motilibacter rhizosphaerae]|uniref:HAD-IA family hydrolase n=1 Tax=Motilibacter rhizosphaerae TaxID=598652 RepID=UPI001E576387|nr:HAD-IA family hydrolase [Motilibacter rhizosphaerae]